MRRWFWPSLRGNRHAPSPKNKPTTSGAAGRRAAACRCRGGRRPTVPRSATPVVIQTRTWGVGLPRLQAQTHRFDHQTAARRGGRSVSLLRRVATAAIPRPTRTASIYCQCPPAAEYRLARSAPALGPPSPCCASNCPTHLRLPHCVCASTCPTSSRGCLTVGEGKRTRSVVCTLPSRARTTGLSARTLNLGRIASVSI